MSKFGDFQQIGKSHGIGGGGDFMKLVDGDNRIRIVSEMVDYTKPNQWEEGKVSVRFMGWVLDRADGQFKILDVGYGVFKDIGMLAVSTDWAFTDLPPYDIVINRKGQKLATEYTIIPTRNEAALSEDEMAKMLDLTPVQTVIDRILAKIPGSILATPNAAVLPKETADADIPVIGEGTPTNEDPFS